MSGAFGEGHIPAEGIRELARLVKSQGLVVLVMRQEYMVCVQEYASKLEALMYKLEASGVWTRRLVQTVSNYSFNKDGLVFVFEKN